jgi:hypothetical protein
MRSLFRPNRDSEDLGVEGEHAVVGVPFADNHDLPGLMAVGNHPDCVAPRLEIMTLERDGLRELDLGRDVGSGGPDGVPIDDTPEELSAPGHRAIVFERDHRSVHGLSHRTVLARLLGMR